MMQQVRDIFFLLLPWTILVPLVIALLRPGFRNDLYKCMLLYLLISFATQLLSFFLWKVKVNNYPVLHVYTLLEFLCLWCLYALLLKKYLSLVYLKIAGVILVAFFIADSFFIEGLKVYNTYSRTLEALFFVFLAVYWFVSIVSDIHTRLHQLNYLVYINSGLLIYFAGSIALFALNRQIAHVHLSMRLNVWTIYSIITAIMYILISVGLWKRREE